MAVIWIFSTSSAHWRPGKSLQQDFMAIFTGTHGLANGLNALIDVAIELQNRGRNDIKLVLVGDGMQKQVYSPRFNNYS